MDTAAPDPKTCPDGTGCPHARHCAAQGPACFRVRASHPHPGVYPDDRWPAAVWAANVLASLPGDPDAPEIVEDAAQAILEALGPSVREDRHVAEWPADEQDVYRHGNWRDGMERADMVQALRARKAAAAVLAALTDAEPRS